MKRLALIALLIIVILLSLQVVRAAETGYALDWWTVDGGGGVSQGGSYSLTGTVGQAEPGVVSGGSYSLTGGFWAALQQVLEKIFLPLVTRS